MGMLKGLGLSIAFSALIVGLWLGLAYLTGWGLGILVVLVGCAAGLGMVLGLKGKGKPAAGVAAVLVALVMMLAGKWGAAVIWADRVEREFAQEHQFSDDEGRLALADQVESEFIEADREPGEPGETGYGQAVIQEADHRWDAMTQEQRVAFWERLVRGDATEEGSVPFAIVPFLFSFGLSGLVLMGIGLAGAYRSAAADNTAGRAESPDVEAPKQAPYGHAFFANLGKSTEQGPAPRPESRSDAA